MAAPSDFRFLVGSEGVSISRKILGRVMNRMEPDGPFKAWVARFGPFAKRGSSNASLKAEDDPYTIELDRALFLIREKEEIAANRIIQQFEGTNVQVLNGRFGPYISDGEMNGKIPKDRDPKSLTFILGFPDWIFWGIVVPWAVCTVVSGLFAFCFMKDEDLDN